MRGFASAARVRAEVDVDGGARLAPAQHVLALPAVLSGARCCNATAASGHGIPRGRISPGRISREATGRDTTRRDRTRRDVARRSAARRGAARHSAAQRSAAQRDATRRDATRRDATRRDATRRDATRRDATRHDATRRDATRHDEARYEMTRYDYIRVVGSVSSARDVTFKTLANWVRKTSQKLLSASRHRAPPRARDAWGGGHRGCLGNGTLGATQADREWSGGSPRGPTTSRPGPASSRRGSARPPCRGAWRGSCPRLASAESLACVRAAAGSPSKKCSSRQGPDGRFKTRNRKSQKSCKKD